MARLRILIRGRVQGVGFRPFVYNLASRFGLKGFVKNSSQGVIIEIEGEGKEGFIRLLKTSPPPLSEIESIEIEELPPVGYSEFVILESSDEGSFTHISPDVSTCDDCLRELLDPEDRRFLYPFINCTNCGPRYSITEALPYDRPNTTMKVFHMCPDCEKEYNDPTNRRFHAQPNACARCGPSLEFQLINPEFKDCITEKDPLLRAIELLSKGAIVAIKGLGGFHIACNGEDRQAVQTLRKRKGRGNKPFALMAPDIGTIKRYCYVDRTEEELLLSSRRPIVLLRKKREMALPGEEIAPDNPYLGFMLPYTPLHYLLFNHPLAKNRLKVLVMTSGNLSEEPIIHKNEEAIRKLSPVVDAFVLHNRDIFMRVDDSVMTRDFFIRRARGYVPEPVVLPFSTGQALAVGADLKNTFTLTKEGYAIVSQHIGDMENLESHEFFHEVLDNLCGLYRVRPQRVVADLHPDYHTLHLGEDTGLPLWRFQHHEAHLGAVMAEHGLTDPIIGIVFDGTGYGTDGTIWGSEFLLMQREGFQRLAHMRPFVLVGGDRGIKEPWRQAISVLKETFQQKALDVIEALGISERIGQDRIWFIYSCIEKRDLGILTSGAGRLFDAVASISGLKDLNTFEAEAPIALESKADRAIRGRYHFDIIEEAEGFIIDWRPAIEVMVKDALKGQPAEVLSTRFHRGLAEATVRLASVLSKRTSIKEIALSGGVFQNRFFLGLICQALREKGLKVLLHRRFPPNDACISLGQAFLLWWRFPDG